MPIPEFSKFVVPNAQGVPTYMYAVKDETARAALAGGMKFVIAWDGKSTPNVTKIPDTVTVRYNGTAYTGTLDPAAAHTSTPMGFWLVSNKSEGNDSFSEYVPVEDTDQTPSVWYWEKVGDVGLSLDDLGALAYMDSIELEKGSGANVVGENASVTASDSGVSFAQHTKKRALGENATFNATNPSVSETRQRIKSESMVGLDGTENKTVTITPTKKKLKKTSVTPAKAKTIAGRDLVSFSKKKLATMKVYSANAPANVDMLSDFTKRKLETKEFPVTVKQENNAAAPPTPYGLDIRLYDSSVHGNISGADSETLVIKFDTTPTLVLGANPPARMATGGLVEDGASGTSAHTAYTNETGGELVNSATKTRQPMVTGRAETEVASGRLADAELGDTETLVNDIDLTQTVNVAEPDTSLDVASGEVVASGETGYANAGDEVVTDTPSTTVAVPKAAAAKQVLIEGLQAADNNDQHVNVLTKAQIAGSINVSVNSADAVDAITELGAATAAAPQITFSKDLKKVALYDDLGIRAEAHPAKRYLNFVTPNGGTISLTKNGSPADISLEYSFDGVNWTAWAADNSGNRSVSVAAGERLYVRSTSVTTAEFSSSTNNYYKFSLPNGTEVNGIVESLLCRKPELADIGLTTTNTNHFYNLFYNCKISGRPVIISKVLKSYSLNCTFKSTQNLNEVEIHSTTIATGAFSEWLSGAAATGTIYAPAALSLAENSNSGVPSGWSRVDINV